MQKPRFRTADKAAWVFLHTRLRPGSAPTISRRTAYRNGFLTAASRRTNRAEKDLPLPFVGEPMSRYLARVTKPAA